jgi:PAS domain S-box-containing protein
MKQDSEGKNRLSSVKIIGIYISAGILWILLSDTIPGKFFHIPSGLKYLLIFKDFLFILIISLIFYLLMRKYMGRSALKRRIFRKNDVLLQGIVKNIPGVIYQFYANDSGEYGFNFVSDRVTEIFGISPNPDNFLNSFTECVPEEDRTRLIKSIRQAVISCTEWEFEGRFIKPDAQMIWFRGISSPEREKDRLIYHGVLLDITEHKQAQNELFIRTQQLEAIRLINNEISHELDLNRLLELIHRRAAELLGVNAGLLSLYDEATRTLTLRSSMGHGEWAKKLSFRYGEGISGTIAAERKGMIINDYRNSSYTIPLIIENTTVTALVAEPMISHGHLVGVITLDNQGMEGRTFTEKDSDILSLFASQAAIAIENARLFENARSKLFERIQAEKALRETEELYRILIETSPDPIIIYDLNGKFLAASTQSARIYGVDTPEEFLKEVDTVFDLLTDEGRTIAAKNFQRTVTDGHSDKTEYSVRIRNGSLITMEVNSSPVYNMAGEPYAFISVLRDITERKRTEKIMIAQRDIGLALGKETSLNEILHDCLDAAIRATESDSGGIYIFDQESKDLNLTCSQGVSEMFATRTNRYAADSDRARLVIMGNPIYFENIYEFAAYHDEDIIKEGFKSVAIIPIVSKDRVFGSLHIASHTNDIIAESRRDVLENIANQIGAFIARVYAEEAMRESESKFRALAEKAIVGIYLIQDNLLIYINSEFADISGYTTEELAGRLNFTELIYPDDLPIVRENIQKRISGEVESLRYDFRLRKKTGEIRHVEVFSSRTLYRGRPAIIGTLLDITDRRKTEDELRRLSTVIEQAVENIVITDTEGTIQYVNPAFEKNTGYSREEAIGQNPRVLKSGVHNQAFYENLWDTIKNGKVWTGRITNRRKDGRFFQEDAIIGPLYSSMEELTGYVALKRDVTETVKLETHLRQAQKMESIGTLAGGIAHDFNNILAGIMGYTELLKFRVSDPKILYYLNEILGGCERARNLVRQILTFSRQTEQEKKPVMLTPIISEVASFLRASLPANIEIRKSVNVSSDVVIADATQIHQVMMNLCTNAGHAMKAKGGVLEILLDEIVIINNDTHAPAVKSGPYLHLAISDTGHGIEHDIIEKIFEPYFTTKEKGEGTGLGLSVVDGIVKSHGGAITVYSEAGKGTIFHIYLPPAEEKAVTGTYPDKKQLPAGNETILFIDDEKVLTEAGKLNLEDLGYRVITETDPAAAIELFRKTGRDIDLVITDKSMPQMSGFDLARGIKSIRKDVPVIVCTGFKERDDAEKFASIGISRFITKPVSIKVLSETIREILDSR